MDRLQLSMPMDMLQRVLSPPSDIDTVSEVTREGRRFKTLVKGRYIEGLNLWIYEGTVTDMITGTSEKKASDTEENCVNKAIDAILCTLRQKGLIRDVMSATVADRRQPTAPTTAQPPAQALWSTTRLNQDVNEQINNVRARADIFQYGIEPDVDGLYTSVTVAPADMAVFDPRSTYVTWESAKKGYIYILNNNQFPQLAPNHRMRRGSEIDIKNVIHVFSELGYEPLIHQNLTRTEILRSLEKTVCRINAEGDRHSSLCLFFMSHGNRGGVSGTDARSSDLCIVTRDEIKGKLSGRRCKALLGKPKLIFIQACRGTTFTRNADDELDAVGTSTAPEQDYVDLDVDGGEELPNNSDIFVADATSNGYYSIRMRREGSWFVQAISEIFLGHAHVDELHELMRKVTCLVTERYRTLFSDEVTKRQFEVRQTPAYESQGMRRRFYFLPKYPAIM